MFRGPIIRSALAIVILLSGVATPPSAWGANTFLRGDANCDGYVDVFDVTYMLCWLFCGTPTPPCCLDALDANDDSTSLSTSINVTDVIYIQTWLSGCGPQPPIPGPFTYGLDPPLPGGPGCATQHPLLPDTPPGATGLAFQFPPIAPVIGGAPGPICGSFQFGKWVCFNATAQLLNATGGNPSPLNIGAWSASIVSVGSCRILEVSTRGLPLYNPPYQIGFQKHDVTNCGYGVVSMVSLDCQTPNNTVPPLLLNPYDMLKLKCIRKVDNSTVTGLRFQDGMECSCPGQPPDPSHPKVRNIVQDACNAIYKPALGQVLVAVVAGIGPNTPASVTPVDVCLNPYVWVTFSSVQTAGTTRACIGPPGPPQNYSAFFNWKLDTTAIYSGPIKVHFRYLCSYDQVHSQAVMLFHSGVQVTPTTNDLCAHVISGVVPVLSPFDLALPPELFPALPFKRGDSNGDHNVDISDGIHILGCQFLGSACSTCPDAADVNDDGRNDISDAISIFSFQFTGGSAPPAPGPATAGLDPTDDDLGPCITLDPTEFEADVENP